MSLRDVKLSSGNVLGLDDAPFEDANELKTIFCEEMKNVRLERSSEMDFDFIKNLICMVGASRALDRQIRLCMKRCTYNGEKITADTWEPAKARVDYIDVCTHVAKENLAPFGKSLSAQFSDLFQLLEKFQPSKSATSPESPSSES